MNREGLRDDIINLAFFWPSILIAWVIAWLRFRNADQVSPPIVPSRIMALWIVLGVILVLLSACLVWLIVKRVRIGRMDPLPWYLVVGPRGSGKSALLKQAGVRQIATWNDDSFVAHNSIILDQVGGHAYGGERRAELVRHVGGEPALQPGHLLEPDDLPL